MRRQQNFPRFPPGNYNRFGPPASRSHALVLRDSVQRPLSTMQIEERERRVRQEIERQVRQEQVRTEYGIDDDAWMQMAPVAPAPQQQQQIIIIIKERKKKKKSKKSKKRKRHHRKSSSSDTDNDNESDADQPGTSQRKRSRRHRHNRKSPTDTDNESDKDKEDQSAGISLKNSSRDNNEIAAELITENEYNCEPNNVVIDPKCDDKNEEQKEKHDYMAVAELNNVIKLELEDNHGMSENSNNKPVGIFPDEQAVQPVEDFMPISHQPFAEQDATTSTATLKEQEELRPELLYNMTIADNTHFDISQPNYYQEESIAFENVEFSILNKRVLANPQDVQAWLEFIDIQPACHAKLTSGSSENPIENRTDNYQSVMRILSNALEANPSNVDLEIKKFQIMEDYLGSNHSDVKDEWERVQNVYSNSIKLWEFNLKRQMNNGSTFNLDKTLEYIDKCIENFKYMEGCDEFLVDLLVARCRLLISAGFIDRAIAMLQALAEFHFFRPYHLLNDPRLSKHDRSIRAINLFQTFWESKVPRIGDAESEGWASFNAIETNIDDWIDYEFDQLSDENDIIRKAEEEEINIYKSNGLTMMEATRRLEQFRTRHYWRPIRHKHDDKQIYECESRITSFRQIKSTLFIIDDIKLCRNLIYKILHIFGVSVLGIDFNSQEDILRTFSPTLFPSFRPNSLQLDKFSKFIENFVKQLAESNLADSARIYTALVTNISNSASNYKDKLKALKLLTLNTDFFIRYNKSDEIITDECQLAIRLSAFEELVKLKPTATDSLVSAWRTLYAKLDEKTEKLWQYLTSQNAANDDQQTVRKRGLLYLRLILLIAHNLPFSDAVTVKTEFDDAHDAVEQNMPNTKREFLLSIWAIGQVSTIPATEENIKMARERVSKYLENAVTTEDPDNLEECRWIGNEHEMIFELAALFAYEFSLEEHGNDKFALFHEDAPLFTSELMTSLTDSQSSVPMEVRVHVLQHITRVHNGLAHDDLMNFISEQVQQFPHSIPLLKALLDNDKNVSMQKRFHWMNTGNDNLTRLIRDCGQLYTTRIQLDTLLESCPIANEMEMRTKIGQFVSIYRSVAEKHSDNLVPDDYIWLTLIRTMVDNKDTISVKQLDEIFTLGQAVCPWSKAFLFEKSKSRPLSADNFQQTLNGAIKKHGLSQYCTEEKIKSKMT